MHEPIMVPDRYSHHLLLVAPPERPQHRPERLAPTVRQIAHKLLRPEPSYLAAAYNPASVSLISCLFPDPEPHCGWHKALGHGGLSCVSLGPLSRCSDIRVPIYTSLFSAHRIIRRNPCEDRGMPTPAFSSIQMTRTKEMVTHTACPLSRWGVKRIALRQLG